MILGRFGGSWKVFLSSWGVLGDLLEGLGGLLDRLGGVLGDLGRSWGHLGRPWVAKVVLDPTRPGGRADLCSKRGPRWSPNGSQSMPKSKTKRTKIEDKNEDEKNTFQDRLKAILGPS